jgi:hypothetical protein
MEAGVGMTEADISAAQVAGMNVDADRRAHYAADILPQGTSYGDEMNLPPVPTEHSKHTGGDDAGYAA